MRFDLHDYLLNKLALRRSVSLPVGLESFDKFAFDLHIPGGIGWMPAQPIAKVQLRLSVRRCANVDVMRTAAAKRWHTLDEEHPVGARVPGPVDVAKTRKRGDQVRPNRNLADYDEDVYNRLRGEFRDGCASEMLNARFERVQHLLDGAGLGDELVGPGRVRLNELDGIFRCVAPQLSIMCHRHGHGILCCLDQSRTIADSRRKPRQRK